MLNELVDEIHVTTGRLRLKLYLFLIVPFACLERINDISEIIKLYRVCLQHIQILITEVF